MNEKCNECKGTGSPLGHPTMACLHCLGSGIKRAEEEKTAHDPVNRPAHYTSHPSGVECIAITEHMSFCVGNAVKYLWRADLKHPDALEDLKKALWYIDREIQRRRVAEGVE